MDAGDPQRYVNSSEIQYISLPPAALKHARLGDVAVVINLANGRWADAIIADVGPHDLIGEGSIALAEELEIDPDPRLRGAEGDVIYVVFPQTGDGKPASQREISATAGEAFDA